MKSRGLKAALAVTVVGGFGLVAGCADGRTGESGFSSPSGSIPELYEAGPGLSSTHPGRCEPAPSSPRSLSPEAPTCDPASGDARAQVVGAHVLGLVDVSIEDTGDIHGSPGASETLLTSGAPGLLAAGVVSASASSSSTSANAVASIASLQLTVLGIGITADAVQSTATAACSSASGTTTIANLKIAGLHVAVTGAPNDAIEVAGILRIVLNEQEFSANGITVRAIHVTALQGGADVTIALSTAATDCGCAIPTLDAGPPNPPTPNPDGGSPNDDAGQPSTPPGTPCDDLHRCGEQMFCDPFTN